MAGDTNEHGRIGQVVRRAMVGVAGSILLVLGAVMLVTPGPGIAVLVSGLMVLAGEFAWAARAVARLRTRLDRHRQPQSPSRLPQVPVEQAAVHRQSLAA